MKELELLHRLGIELDPPTDTLPPGLRSRALVAGLHEQTAPGKVAMRRLAVVGALAAVAVATAVSLAVALPSAPATNADLTADVHMHLAAWSVDTNPDKTVTVTFRELTDPQKLSEILAKAGVRAKVQFVQAPEYNHRVVIGCYKQGPHALQQIDKVFSLPRDVDGAKVFTITPAAMPRGSVLSVVFFALPPDAVSNSPYDGPVLTLFDGKPDQCVPIPPAVAASTGP